VFKKKDGFMVKIQSEWNIDNDINPITISLDRDGVFDLLTRLSSKNRTVVTPRNFFEYYDFQLHPSLVKEKFNEFLNA
jgi:hypothetical protein